MKTRTFGTARFSDGEWLVEADPHVMIRLKRVFQKIDKRQFGTISFTNTPENCRDLAWFIDRYPLVISDMDRARLSMGVHTYKETTRSLEELLDPNYTPPLFEMSIPPRDYQSRAAAIAMKQGYLLVADDLGLGKSLIAICPFTEPRYLPAVVVAYPHLQRQWQAEISKFLPGLYTHIVTKRDPYELPKRDGKSPDVLVTTYMKLANWVGFIQSYCKYVVFDEAQELRRSASEKYGAAKAIAASMRLRMLATATPIYGFGSEIFNVLSVAKPDCLGTWDEFSREWCPGGWNRDKARVHDPRALGTYLRENFLMIRRTRAEVGRELPPVIRIPQCIDADVSALDDIADTAGELARTILKATGGARGEKMQAAEELSNILRQQTGISKAPYVADFVRLLLESEDKILLAGWHRAVYEIWASKLKDFKIAWYTGSESPAAKEQSRKDFVDGDARIMFISLRSGAGLDGLQKSCRTFVAGELDWAPGVMDQCIGRLNRDGQTDTVMAYFLVSEYGADPIMSDVLGVKARQLSGIRDPNADLIEKLDRGEDNVRRLAEDYLARHGKRIAGSIYTSSDEQDSNRLAVPNQPVPSGNYDPTAEPSSIQ